MSAVAVPKAFFLTPLAAALALSACGGGGDAVAEEGPTETAAALSAPVTVPYIEHVQQVAADAAATGGTSGLTVTNSWGGHQSRVVRHNDGTLRVLYLRHDAEGQLHWRLMKRAAGSTAWREEKTGATTDDVNLLRDPRSDRAHVLAWPASRPTTFTSPYFQAKTIPGSWKVLADSARHYGASGIGADGTACLKVVQERAGTGSVDAPYICGRYSSTAGSWSWHPQVVPYEGLRHAYGYLFPAAAGDGSFVSVAQRDLRKDVAGLPLASAQYVFNGVRLFRGGMADGSNWLQTDVADPLYAPPDATAVPRLSQIDAFVDRQGRVISTYWLDDPLDAAERGIYSVVADGHGNTLFRTRWAGLPAYGKARLFDDAKGRMWLLWSGRGSQRTELRLYPVMVSTSPALSMKLGAYTDLAPRFAPYAFDGTVALTLPRNGHTVGNSLDGLMFACAATFSGGVSVDSARCYRDGGQRLLHFRLRLPD